MSPFEHMGDLRTRFLARAAQDSSDIAAADAAGDIRALRSISHGLAGAAGTFGFHELSAVASHVERAIEGGADLQLLRPLVANLRATIERSR